MKKREDIERRTEELAEPIARENGCSIYDVEFVKEGNEQYLRLFIDKEGGVSVQDCEAVSRQVDPVLDREDFVPGAYIFEVSSPGLTRTLRKDRHFAKSLGLLVDLTLFQKTEAGKEFHGRLASFDNGTVTLEDTEGAHAFDRGQIASVRLSFDQQTEG